MYAKLRFSCLLAAFCGVCVLAAHPAIADSAPTLSLQDLLSRHLTALGKPQADTDSKTERVTGTIETGGLHGTYTIISQGYDKFWAEDKLGIYDSFSGSDGKVSWQRDSNGTVRLLSSEELKNQKNDEYLESISYAFPDRLPGTVMLRPQTERRTGNYIVDIVPDGGKPATLFFDPKTFLIVKEQHQDDDLTITTTFSNYQMSAGTMTAMSQRSTNGDKKYDEIRTITSDDINVKSPDSLYALPTSPKNYRWEDPKATSVIIPFDAYDQAINLYVGINGRPAFVTLDSGTSDLTIAKYAVDLLKIPHQGTFEARGYGGSTNIYPVKLDSFEIPDGVLFSGLTATAIDLPFDYGRYSVVPSVGLIGYTLLSQFVVQIDYASQEITLYDPDTWAPDAKNGTPLPMDIDDNVPSVLAQFDGLPPARFLVDTGDSSWLRLYTPFVAQNHLAERYPKGQEDLGIGVGGESKSRRVRANAFTIAGTTLKNVPTDLSLDTKGGASHVLAGAVGHEFLSHFVVTFDYPHRRIFFAPDADTAKPFDTRTFGIYVLSVPDDLVKNKQQIVIVYVDDKSPAYKAGLARGTTITAIDGVSVDALGLGEVRRLLSPDGGKNDHELKIVGPNGGTGNVKVSLYDPMPAP